jgi:hypothetical protein
MKVELNNQALAYIQAFELTTKSKVDRVHIGDKYVIFYVNSRNFPNPRLIRKFIKSYGSVIGRQIYVVPSARNPKMFIIRYFRGVARLSPANISIARGIVVIRVPPHVRRKLLGRKASRIRTLEKILKETFGNISKVVVVESKQQRSRENNARKESSERPVRGQETN